jgi:hypothetical protein
LPAHCGCQEGRGSRGGWGERNKNQDSLGGGQ